MASPAQAAIVIVCKVPKPHHTKTRLVSTLGPERSALLAEAMLCDMVAKISNISISGSQIHKIIYFKPASMESELRRILSPVLSSSSSSWTFLPMATHPEETSTDLTRVLQDVLVNVRPLLRSHSLPHLTVNHAITIVGMDSPTLPASEIARSLQVARSNQAYITPATDGGYVLLGIPERCGGEIFENVGWSEHYTAVQQIREIERGGVTVRISEEVVLDVDEKEDLEQLLLLAESPPSQIEMNCTREFLGKWCKGEREGEGEEGAALRGKGFFFGLLGVNAIFLLVANLQVEQSRAR